MSSAGDTLTLTPTETLRIVSSTAEALEVEATYGANGSPPPPHFHPAQDEHFEVIEGAMTVKRAGETHTVAAGETFSVPPRQVHSMWNAGSAPARVTWTTTPAGRTEQWFRAIDALHAEGRVGRNGMPGPLAFSVLLNEYSDVFRLGVGPDRVVRAGLSLLAPLGRLRGYTT